MKPAIATALLLSSLLLEWYAVNHIQTNFNLIIFFHAMACIALVASVYVVMITRFKENNGAFYSFLYGLSFFMPIGGGILSLFIASSLYQRYSDIYKEADTIENVIELEKIKPTFSIYGAGGLLFQLFNKKAKPIDRTKALFTLGQKHLAQINAYIYQLLPDTSDEMRLLAFNILDEEEGELTQKIQAVTAELEASSDEITQGKLYKSLAILHWELVYGQLILPELEHTILDNALNYAKKSSMYLTKDAELWALIGKIHKRLKRYTEAEKAFIHALALNIPPAHVLPYLAEMKYNTKDYKAMMAYLNQSKTLDDIPDISQIKKFWNNL